MKKLDIALLGLGVMGSNLALNIADKGWNLGVWNRMPSDGRNSKVEEFLNTKALDTTIEGYTDLPDLILKLKKPRIVLLMVKAGEAVDDMIRLLIPLLEKGDIIIDGGNSYFKDTERRVEKLNEIGIEFVGCGISGGEYGALHGPSIMPGGASEAWNSIKPILTSIAAKTEDGKICCEWIGGGGSGHYVKMIHNGIEYGEMETIAEIYLAMKHLLQFSNENISNVFDGWNKGRLKSFLLEIASDILNHKDYNGDYVVDLILDASRQKGTGKWSVESALDLGVSLNLVSESVFARILSDEKDLRGLMAKHYPSSQLRQTYNSIDTVTMLEHALYCSRLMGYSQGFSLMRKASDKYVWNVNLCKVAQIWRAGCIIRAEILKQIEDVYFNTPLLQNFLLDSGFYADLQRSLASWEKIVGIMLRERLAAPTMSAALNYFIGVTTERCSANLIQAMRDYFGAHTFERVGRPRGEFFHEIWRDNFMEL